MRRFLLAFLVCALPLLTAMEASCAQPAPCCCADMSGCAKKDCAMAPALPTAPSALEQPSVQAPQPLFTEALVVVSMTALHPGLQACASALDRLSPGSSPSRALLSSYQI